MRLAEKIKELPPSLQYRAFEKLLKRHGFTGTQAKIIVSEGYRKLLILEHEREPGNPRK